MTFSLDSLHPSDLEFLAQLLQDAKRREHDAVKKARGKGR